MSYLSHYKNVCPHLSQKHAHTHTHTHTYTQTQTQTQTHTHTHAGAHTRTQTHTHTDTDAHAHTHTRTRTRTRTQTHTHAGAHTRTQVRFPGNTYWQYKCIAWMPCKSLWIKVSAKCINVNVNDCRINYFGEVWTNLETLLTFLQKRLRNKV